MQVDPGAAAIPLLIVCRAYNFARMALATVGGMGSRNSGLTDRALANAGQ
jgi:hypothetical protein